MDLNDIFEAFTIVTNRELFLRTFFLSCGHKLVFGIFFSVIIFDFSKFPVLAF